METVLFWAAVLLTLTKVLGDTWNRTLRRELLAMLVAIEVGLVVGAALLLG